ncbi:MAG: DedA family protein [Planctomycetes bacterium]|nr:DedA family protein [Planctomycetota bacterium]
MSKLKWLLVAAIITELVALPVIWLTSSRPKLSYDLVEYGPFKIPNENTYFTNVRLWNSGNEKLTDVLTVLSFEGDVIDSDFSWVEAQNGSTKVTLWQVDDKKSNEFRAVVADFPRGDQLEFVVMSSGTLERGLVEIRSSEVVGMPWVASDRPISGKRIRSLVPGDPSSTEIMIRQLGPFAAGLLMFTNGIVSTPPSEAVMGIAGFFAASGRVSFMNCLMAGLAGNVIGHYLLYWFAIRLGDNLWARKRWKLVIKILGNEAKRESVMGWYKRFNPLTDPNAMLNLLLLRCIPSIRSVVSVAAAFSGMSTSKFLLATILGDLLWIVMWMTIGVVFGPQLAGSSSSTQLLMGLLIGTIMILILVLVRERTTEFVQESNSQ